MAKRHIFNSTAAVMFLGGIMIPPGDGREIDEAFLPPADPLPPQPELVADGGVGDGGTGGGDGGQDGPDAAALRANLADQLKQSVKALLPTLADASDATLAGLAEIEGASETPRVTLLNAIAALQLQRAEQRASGQANAQAGADGTATTDPAPQA